MLLIATVQSGVGLVNCVRNVVTCPMIISIPAVLVVVSTTTRGISVTHTYRVRPSLIKNADTTARAITASVWLAMPNVRQITSKLSEFMNHAHPSTTSAVLTIAPGSQLVTASFGWINFPAASCNKN